MPTPHSDRKVNTRKPNRSGAVPEQRQPHKRDEAPEGTAQPRGVMRQAADDVAQGLVDTDLHNQGGLAPPAGPHGASGQARPQPDAAEGMRGQPSAPTAKPRK